MPGPGAGDERQCVKSGCILASREDDRGAEAGITPPGLCVASMTNQAQRPPGTPRSASPRRIARDPGNSADNLGLIVLDQFRTVASVHCRRSSGLIEYPLPTRLGHSNCHAAMACLGKAVIHSRCLNNSGIVPKGAAAGLGVVPAAGPNHWLSSNLVAFRGASLT